ncbi:Na+/H+ antiporter NhaA [Salinibacterium hongtaonis]|uniref:Na+/H+ antiporter NhaA n=1 Tax=Homoserinimonas hongtaonis TaxID=2079791 RepID=UPI000D34CF44|nr:Na+/H+ antiporter NhaA [Salinibacterium hongtaonis]AWB88165.1 Na+/H+ antiporter NhaA [Salinibacterium hongtaonis]
MNNSPVRPRLLSRGRYSEAVRIGEILRRETVGGAILVVAAVVALIWANSPAADSYFVLRDFRFGYEPWHLDLSLGQWASDGLLAIFFFLVGLELKREFVAGDLRNPSKALVPVAAAFGGVAVPALIYVAINWGNAESLRGWATPAATDIAFAVAVLAIIGSSLPTALRLFLLTLAVVDDLIAIAIIAIAYTEQIQIVPLLLCLIPFFVYLVLAQVFRDAFARHRWMAWVILLPIGAVMWALLHASGIHATIAGVALGFAVPVLHKAGAHGAAEQGPGLAEQFEHRFRPLSSGFAVPVFAFFAAGVAIGGLEGFTASLSDTITIGIIVALVVGKPIGILGTTWLLSKLTRAKLDESLRWIDLLGVGLLAGIGFTVSLLIAELSFGHGVLNDHAKVGILCASLLAALLGAIVLIARNRHYKAIAAEDLIDENADGIPDSYQRGE